MTQSGRKGDHEVAAKLNLQKVYRMLLIVIIQIKDVD